MTKPNTTHWYTRRLARRVANALAPVLFIITPTIAIVCLTSVAFVISASLLASDVAVASLAFWVYFHDPSVFGPATYS